MTEAAMLVMEMVFEDEDADDELEFIFGSSSSSDEDEEAVAVTLISNARRKIEQRPRCEGYFEKTVPGYSASEFKSHFRLFPETFEFLLQLIGPFLSRRNPIGRRPIPPRKQLLLALWVMATPDSYRSVSTKFGVGKATAIRTMRRVAHGLHKLAPRFIKWPQGQEAIEVMTEFERSSGFPGVIGAIDGTHVEIRAPHDDEHQAYVNRKGYPSIQVQAVCTHQLIFTSVFAGNAGSVHDARVFRLSPVAQYLENSNNYFPNDSHLVGDATYGIHPHVMVPYKDNGHLSVRQKNCNFCHSSARVAIDRACGLWKGRCRSVLDCLHMVTLSKIPEYLVATMVLHNICISRGDMIDVDFTPSADIDRGRLVPGRVEDGNAKRQRITDSLLMRYN